MARIPPPRRLTPALALAILIAALGPATVSADDQPDQIVASRLAEFLRSARTVISQDQELVRNRKARPDEWEKAVLTDKFAKPDWPKGQAFSEAATVKGQSAFRLLVPEYYKASCLSCHGSPKGEMDITGYPKEGGKEGDLGAVISITLYH